ncbi:PH domain-containing protein [Nocardioides pacificus]
MPADSEPVPLPRTWRPFGVRIAVIGAGVGLAAVLAVAGVALGPEIRAKFTVFEVITMIFLAGLVVAVGYALARSRVTATDEGLVVVNGFRRRDYAWAQVVAIHLTPGAPWAVLDLTDGTTASAIGIQGSDGSRATQAVRELDALINR